ncbi:hypothetical protein BRADI_1g30475v3 [Brachypodium distachyon]|uniref:WRC domain-containing protein n=1 Tax=Brachypodium distachyon TaxID=15368 RepID=A0A2K2DM33_BRADI|nr:hypothetical protein BRADI_1g30475v3 [Brachypodium distachyon]
MLESEEDKGVAAGGAERVSMCKNNDGRRWFYRRTLSEPNLLCSYHADRKIAAAPPAPPPAVSKTTNISKPARKRNVDAYEGSTSSTLEEIPPAVEQQESPPTQLQQEKSAPPKDNAAPTPAVSKPTKSSNPTRKRKVVESYGNEAYYYYNGFGPSRTERYFKGSSSTLEEIPPVVEQQESPPTELQQEKSKPPKDNASPTPYQAQVDDADINEPVKCVEMDGIAGWDEEISDDAFGFDGESPVVGVNGGIKRKIPVKNRSKKPVKVRFLKSLVN